MSYLLIKYQLVFIHYRETMYCIVFILCCWFDLILLCRPYNWHVSDVMQINDKLYWWPTSKVEQLLWNYNDNYNAKCVSVSNHVISRHAEDKTFDCWYFGDTLLSWRKPTLRRNNTHSFCRLIGQHSQRMLCALIWLPLKLLLFISFRDRLVGHVILVNSA